MRALILALPLSIFLAATTHAVQFYPEQYQSGVDGVTLPISLGTDGTVSFRLRKYNGPTLVEVILPAIAGVDYGTLVLTAANATTYGVNWSQFESSLLNPFELLIETSVELPDQTTGNSKNFVFPSAPTANRLDRVEITRLHSSQNLPGGWQRASLSAKWIVVIATPEPSTLPIAISGALVACLGRRVSTRRQAGYA